MSDPEGRPEIHNPMRESMEELRRADPGSFEAELKEIVREAENMRLRYMKSRQTRSFISLTLGFIFLVAGAAGFGWYFMMEGDLAIALACLLVSVIPTLFLRPWTQAPLRKYVRAHKARFMPKLAKALGGFRYDAAGGIHANILGKTGVIPAHDSYACEDCFIGLYKGIKVIFCEARLGKGGRSVFSGLFALLEMPQKISEGHIILTSDKTMVRDYAQGRWQKLQAATVTTSNPAWNRFAIYASKPDDVPQIVTEKLLKELSEASDIFNRSLLSAAIFQGRYIFIMIPHKDDMFEASDSQAPVPINEHAETRRKEIAKLLEVIDVFEIYKKEEGR